MTTPKILTPQIANDLQAGINTIRSPLPTDSETRDKAIAAMLELQLRKAQGLEIGRGGIKLNGWLAIVAFAVIVAVLAWKVNIPDCIRAWRGGTAEVQEATE